MIEKGWRVIQYLSSHIHRAFHSGLFKGLALPVTVEN
jgi:hypothetical protein